MRIRWLLVCFCGGCGLPMPVTDACALDRRVVVDDLDVAPEGADFALSAALGVLAGAFAGEATWADGADSPATFSVEPSGEAELFVYDDGERCPPQYMTPVSGVIASEDGWVDEQFETTLAVSEVDAGSLHAAVAWADLVGTALPRSLDLEDLTELDLELSGVGAAGGWTLSLTWSGREITAEDNEYEVDERTEAAGTLELER